MQTWRDVLGTDRAEAKFTDFKPKLSEFDSNAEANRCINCYDAPCIRACPTSINIPQFISRISNGNLKGAAKTILDSNIMGLSCSQACPTEVLCEGACVYNSLNKRPIGIGKLQRVAVEYAYDHHIQFYQPGKATGKKVALVGAGPASLACAHELRKHGHAVTIFEKSKIPGGLNTQGIAPYKMKADVSLREIEYITAIGVQIEYSREMGRNLGMDQLLRDFDAVFLGLGLGPDSKLEVPGSDHPLVQGAVDFIAKIKTLPAQELSWLSKTSTALVVGGGNTAIDACRELKALGIPRVVVSYRRGESDMSGYVHEFKWARQEGVEFWFHTLPTHFASDGTQSLTVTLGSTRLGSDGKVSLTGETTVLKPGLVLLATGQSKLESLIRSVPGLTFSRGSLQVDPTTGQTGNPKVFAGGDLANGGKEVVNAVAEGKRAAVAIHKTLSAGGKTHG